MKTSAPLLEICLESVESAIAAEQGGAQRIELCADLLEGGITPSAGLIRAARERLDIPINVMIRPRGGDFLYTDAELAAMRYDIELAKELGADGVVFGLLRPDGTIDVERTGDIVALAYPLPVTFHRAFDLSRDLFASLEGIIEAGVERLLTSGGKASVADATKTVRKLVQQAGDRIIVMPGGGVTEENIAEIAQQTGARELHLALEQPFESGMEFRQPGVPMGAIEEREYLRFITLEQSIRDLREKLRTAVTV